ncbi:cytochrome P450 [Streptomyces thermolineatus]|uniref:Cytochrome P450 n=1 Tax=Streptomyces thermolineatus TaxID=44033 RepID=A0ABP5YET5_9ACTN
MTAPPPDPFRAGPAPAPPPGCPAHAHAGSGPAGPEPARLYGPEAGTDPMGLYERLRAEHGPVAPVLLDGDLPAWLVLGYRENLEVARTPTRFSRDSRRWRDWKEGRVPEDSPILPIVRWEPVCTFADGEEHERLRRALTESMERFDRRGIRRRVTRLANGLIDDFAARGRAELMGEYAQQLPMLVMTSLFGMPEADGPRLVRASLELIMGSREALEGDRYILETLRLLVERKRAAPGADLASWLMEHPAGLTDEEVVQHLRLLLLSAHETTTNLIANTLRMVLTDRRFRASLAGVRMTVPDAVEQVLWDEPPLMICPARWATGDTEIAGQPIRAGDMLLLGLAAGNVDPAVRPDRGTPMHGNRSHLAFSRGPHECPGQDIGRAVTDTAVDTLLMRLPDVAPEGGEEEPARASSWVSRRLVELPVAFAARPPTLAGGLRLPQPRPRPAAATVPADLGEDTAHGRVLPESGPPPRPTGWWSRIRAPRGK